MKLIGNKVGLLVRLGLISGAMLFTQQALAVGTPAGETISNTATVDYFVGGVDQGDIDSNTVSFVVDRNVNFTLEPVGTALVNVTPGGTNYFVDFLLTNISNSALDFNLVYNQLAGGPVRSSTDNVDMINDEYAVSANSVANGDTDPAKGGPLFVDELAADDAIRIRVWGDAALSLDNLDVAGVSIEAIAAEPNTAGEGTALTETANTLDNVENVFADANNDGTQTALDGFLVAAPDLTVDKAILLITDDLGGNSPLPNAVVEYTITIENASTTSAADTVTISDPLDDDVDLELATYNGNVNDIEIDNGGTLSYCDADPSDGDGCSLNSGTLSIGAPAVASIATSTTLVVKYRVRIKNPATTPPPSP